MMKLNMQYHREDIHEHRDAHQRRDAINRVSTATRVFTAITHLYIANCTYNHPTFYQPPQH